MKEPKLRKTKKKIVTFFEGKEADQTFSPIEISRELGIDRRTTIVMTLLTILKIKTTSFRRQKRGKNVRNTVGVSL